MSESPKPDEKRFNDTVKRMLRTPPKPHEKGKSFAPSPSSTKNVPLNHGTVRTGKR